MNIPTTLAEITAKVDTFKMESARLRQNGPAASFRFEMIESAANLADDIKKRASNLKGK